MPSKKTVAFVITLLVAGGVAFWAIHHFSDPYYEFAYHGRFEEIPKDKLTPSYVQVCIDNLGPYAEDERKVVAIGRLEMMDQSIADSIFAKQPNMALERLPAKYVTDRMIKKMLGEKEKGVSSKILDRSDIWTPERIEWLVKERDLSFLFSIDPNLWSKDQLRLLVQAEIEYFKQSGLAGGVILDSLSRCPLWDEELVQLMLSADKIRNSYACIPPNFRTWERSVEAVQKDYSMLYYVPREQLFKKDGFICQLALKQSDDAIRYIPELYKRDWHWSATRPE